MCGSALVVPWQQEHVFGCCAVEPAKKKRHRMLVTRSQFLWCMDCLCQREKLPRSFALMKSRDTPTRDNVPTIQTTTSQKTATGRCLDFLEFSVRSKSPLRCCFDHWPRYSLRAAILSLRPVHTKLFDARTHLAGRIRVRPSMFPAHTVRRHASFALHVCLGWEVK